MSVAAPGNEYDSIAEEALKNLREELKYREVELKKKEVDTRVDN